jgi:ankyrin repeat protein
MPKKLACFMAFLLACSAFASAYYIETRFAQALLDNNLEEVSRLIELGLEIDKPFPSGDLQYKNLMPGYSPLMYCIASGKFEMAKLLINNGAQLNFQDELAGNTALSLAIDRENIELVALLLKKGADPNICKKYMGPALFSAIGSNNYAIFTLLIDYHADIFYKDTVFGDEMKTALDMAELRGSRKMALWLKKAGVANGCAPETKEEYFFQAVKDNDIRNVKKYIGQGMDPNYKDTHERTALMWAVMYGYHDLVRFLLDHGADIAVRQEHSNFIPLLTAADNGDLELVKLCLDRGIDINIQDKYRDTALLLSCKEQHTEIVKYLLDRGADPAIRGFLDLDAFWYAFEKKNYQILELLIKHKTNLDSYYISPRDSGEPRGFFPATALFHAVYYDDVEMASFLLDHGADADAVYEHGLSPLGMAVIKNNYAPAELLIQKKADVRYVNKTGYSIVDYAKKVDNYYDLKLGDVFKLVMRTIKEYAAPDFKGVRFKEALYADDLEYIRLLVERGADVNQKLYWDSTPLIIACAEGNPEIVAYLISMKAEVNYAGKESGITPLLAAAANGNPKVIELLIKHHADINLKNTRGLTALDEAVIKNNIEAQKLLHAHNALPGDLYKLITNYTLFEAAKTGNLELMKLGIRNKMDIEARDNIGSTLLIRAAEYGQADMVELLIKSGARLDTQNDFGNTALMAAADEGRLESARLLITHNAALELKDKRGETALCIACTWGYGAIAELLVAHNADVNIRDEYNETLLANALLHGYHNISLLLAETAKDFDAPGSERWTPLMQASLDGFADVCALLIQRGAGINTQTDYDQETALHMAAEDGHLETVTVLVKNGAALDLQDREGETPLISAVEQRKIEIVAYLLSKGADPAKKTADGKTALDIAKENQDEEIINLLLQAGAE